MNARPEINTGLWSGRADLLSSEEERVLSEVRELVRGIREEGKPDDLRALIEGVGRAGGSLAGEGDDLYLCKFSGTCFSIRSIPEGGFEISFSHEDR